MNPKNVQEAIQNLQRFLLDEYGWDTQATSNQSMGCSPQSEQTNKLEAKNLPTNSTKTRGNTITL